MKVILKGRDVIFLYSFKSKKIGVDIKILFNDFEYMKISAVDAILLLHDYEGEGNVFFWNTGNCLFDRWL